MHDLAEVTNPHRNPKLSAVERAGWNIQIQVREEVSFTDGRLFVIEYKGKHLDNDDTHEKELIGKVWAKRSGNLFLIAWKDKNGRDVQQKIHGTIVG